MNFTYLVNAPKPSFCKYLKYNIIFNTSVNIGTFMLPIVLNIKIINVTDTMMTIQPGVLSKL